MGEPGEDGGLLLKLPDPHGWPFEWQKYLLGSYPPELRQQQQSNRQPYQGQSDRHICDKGRLDSQQEEA